MKTDKEKELDKLFKEGLENPSRNTNFREDDWDAMEAMLDSASKPRGIIAYWIPIVSSIAAMLLLTMVWFLLKHGDEPTVAKNPTKPVIHAKKDTISDNSAANNKQQLASLKPDTVSNKNASGIAINEATHKSGINTRVQGASSTQNIASLPHIKKAGHGKTILPNVNAPSKGLSADEFVAIHNAKQPVLVDPASPGYVTDPNEGKSFAPLSLPTITSPLSADALVPALKDPKILAAQQPADKPAIKRINPNRPQYAITVLASPDINGVSSFQNSKVGTNVGLMFSATLGKKFTLSTGAVYSKKPYDANFADYKTGAYVFKYNPDNVTADCRVLDVPLNLNYQLYSKARNSFSVGTGLSSYIMLHENYRYNYNTPVTVTYGTVTTTYSPPDYNVSNVNRHYLGVLNLDVTYSHKINSKFSLDVEPYYKIPLTNIGAGQVKLQSTGIALGVTWNINSPPK